MRTGPVVALLVLGPLGLAQQPAEAPAETVPPPVAERQVHGSVDFGNRWVLGNGGNEDVYRSIVNLGEGPKLFGAETTIRYPGGRWYDRLDARASSWGGDPYNTARLEAARTGAYAFRFDYRNVSYFNSLPSFANPFLGQGVLFSQRSLDTKRRLIDTELEYRPGARLSGYLGFYHGSGFGRGVTTFVTDGNEFPVGTRLRDATDSYRGGLRLNLVKWNLTLEQGGTTFKDDQQVSFGGAVNPGNRRVPLLGQDILLRDLAAAYGARGNSIFNRGVLEGRPWSKLHFTGHFLYSQPSIDVNYSQRNTGNFVWLETFQVFTGQLDRSLGQAGRPHSSGSWTTEFRLTPRIRVIQSWFTDRLHVAGASSLATTLTPASGGSQPRETALRDRLVLNWNQHQVDAIAEVSSFLTLRGGHRYEWGDAVIRSNIGILPAGEAGEIRRQVALAGGSLRLRANVDLDADLEASARDRTFFRTDLADYQRARLRGRYRLRRDLTLSGSFAILNNQTPVRDVSLDYQSRQSSLALLFAPSDGRRWNLLLDYMRGTLRSSLPSLAPQDRTSEISRYREDGHYGGATVEIHPVGRTRIHLGGSLGVTAGSRPTRYYQPYARLLSPLRGKVAWMGDWRWFGFTERRYAFESFHAHLFSTGLQVGW